MFADNFSFGDFMKALFSTIYGWIAFALLVGFIVASVIAFSNGSIVLGIGLVIVTAIYLVGLTYLLSWLYTMTVIFGTLLFGFLQGIFGVGF